MPLDSASTRTPTDIPLKKIVVDLNSDGGTLTSTSSQVRCSIADDAGVYTQRNVGRVLEMPDSIVADASTWEELMSAVNTEVDAQVL